jgi:hypothetical protein
MMHRLTNLKLPSHTNTNYSVLDYSKFEMDYMYKSIYRTGCVRSERCKGVAAELSGVVGRMMYLILKCAVDKRERYKS